MCSREMERKPLMQARMSLRMHLVMCSGCLNCRRHMQAMRSALKHHADGAAVSTSDEADGER